MCGICGIVSFDRKVQIDVPLITRMMRAIEHRGPDDKGYHLDESSALGHVRLSIIDVAQGHQPIYNEDKTSCIVFNGEIYNYLDLRAGLVSKGHVFQAGVTQKSFFICMKKKDLTVSRNSEACLHSPSGTRGKKSSSLRGTGWGYKTPLLQLGCSEHQFFVRNKVIAGYRPCPKRGQPFFCRSLSRFELYHRSGDYSRGIKKLMPGHYLVCRNGRVVIKGVLGFQPGAGNGFLV
jgi:asparagine synthase (glutamine-hydrolysing)